jgi:Adenylate cyclase associated (CAP) C terminal
LLQVYLPEATAAATEITTAKASALNIIVLGPPDGQEDPVEHAIPEQFVSKLVNGKFVTTPVTHG